MKYSRGKVLALTILSLAMALALFCTGYIIDLRTFTARAANNNISVDDTIQSFDDLYQYVPFTNNDSGSVTLGQTTTLTLTEERYALGNVNDLLNSDNKLSYANLQAGRKLSRPVFDATEMFTIASGRGNSLKIPVVMLDPDNYDDFVLFELTNLIDVPTHLEITRDGERFGDLGLIKAVDVNLSSDNVYAGIPNYTQNPMSSIIGDLVQVSFKPNGTGYIVSVKNIADDSNNFYQINDTTNELEEVQSLENRITELRDEEGNLLYRVIYDKEKLEVKVYVRDTTEVLGTVVYNKEQNRSVTYGIGAVAYNGNALRGMFQEQGFYRISFKQKIPASDGILTEVSVAFDFVIVHKIYYKNFFPRFNTDNLVDSKAEIYNYTYENEFPEVEYSSKYFDVTIQTTEKYDPGVDGTQRRLRFYNIGDYQMISKLQYKSSYLSGIGEDRGVKNGVVQLTRYLPYSSTLRILGFQAYYGGQHQDEAYNGPLPFYDEKDKSKSSDISNVIRDAKMMASSRGYDITNLDEAYAIEYSNKLAQFITDEKIEPVRTNFAPVKLRGNAQYVTGDNASGEKAVISTVAYKAAYGMNANQWKSSLLEAGAPFDEAGQYVVSIYFKVNNDFCQQVFFFEITNHANILFDVTNADGETMSWYAGQLELNRIDRIEGSRATIRYNGDTTLGQFEVPPVISYSYLPFNGKEEDRVVREIPTQGEGALTFNLYNVGDYRLTIKYGAHAKSATVFNFVIDDSPATGIKANTKAKSLADYSHIVLPENLAVVGAGEVNLTWDRKPSGIQYSNVIYSFHAMNLENPGIDPNADRNYFSASSGASLQKLAKLYSADAFSKTATKPNFNFEPVLTADGWTLEQTFTEPGLHHFTLVDDVGNQTEYFLIIDDSTPTFVQSGGQPSSNLSTNIVNFDESTGVYVGFGKTKLVAGLSGLINGLQNDLLNSGILTKDTRRVKIKEQWINMSEIALSVGILSAQYSISGDTYKPVENFENGYIRLTEEGTYYFRVTDLLGNVGEYYIMITHDGCLGRVYADAETNRPEISNDSDHMNLGFTYDKPDQYTSLVTNTGGMTNRPYVTFSFEQKDEYEPFSVQAVYMQYYPKTYQKMSSIDPTKPNPNYPFSDKKLNNPLINGVKIFAHQYPDSGIIYEYSDVDVNKTVRLTLYNNGTITPDGMYILTRIYHRTGGSDPLARNYYFIVDRQEMIYAADGERPYQSEFKVSFSKQADDSKAKIADATYMCEHSNQISSDRTAWVTGFNSKYSYFDAELSYRHDSTEYVFDKLNKEPVENPYYNYIADYGFGTSANSYNFNFPSLIPHFSFVYEHETYYLGQGKTQELWAVGDPAMHNDSSLYELIVADDARSISCMLVNGNVMELKNDENAPTSANYSILSLDLDINRGTKAEIQISENKVITNSDMEYDGQSYYYIINTNSEMNQTIEQLTFSFVNDKESMFTDINLDKTVASWKSSGFMRPISFTTPEPDANKKYTFDLLNEFLNGQVIADGASIAVSLYADDDSVTNYVILFDASAPNYNLTRIKDGDNLARTLKASQLHDEYVYGVSNDFTFEAEQGANRYLDTRTINYREVIYNGDGTIQASQNFELYTGKGSKVPFATLVGLRDNEMRYYRITEIDYAGNYIDYLIQIQGKDYLNKISFIGAVSDEKDDIQIGVEMRALESSVHQFFLNNDSYRFENGDDYYTVIGNKASWRIGDDIDTGTATEERLMNTLNNWINIATENGTKCSYKLYDRIGDVEVFEFYNIRANAVKIQLDCYQAGENGSFIVTNVTNLNSLPRILFEDNLAPYFKIKVEDAKTREVVLSETEIYFSLHGTEIPVDNISSDYIITVTDPFGRVSITEYHQQKQSTLKFNVYGNTINKNGVIYAGDERGIEFSYAIDAYSVFIYDYGTGELLNNLQSFISNNMRNHKFVPTKNATTIEQYRIVATGLASGATLFEQIFIFDTRLPDIHWKNASDQTLNEVEGQTFVSDVCLDLSENLVKTDFPVTISYKRVHNNKVEYMTLVTLNPGTTDYSYTFKKPGKYEVTLRNTVWAEETITFEIDQIDNNLVLVYDNGVQIQASPSNYKYFLTTDEFIEIPRYVFTRKNSEPITDYQVHNLHIDPNQTNRVLAGIDEGKDYYYYDNKNNTLVWRLAFLIGVDSKGKPVYDNPIYFATTAVASGELDSSIISLKLNGIPNAPASNKELIIAPSQTTYHIVTNDFMKTHDDKLEVRLHYGVKREPGKEDVLPYNRVEGNVILVDCYFNGTLVKTLVGDGENEVFTINRYDAGYYEFVVHDLVGNYLYFGSSDNVNDISYRQTRYMLVVRTNPMVTINGKQPFNGMIYNDQVELKLVNYGNEFLAKLHADDLATDKLFFNKRFCVSKIEETYNGETTIINVDGNQSSFYWSNPGTYRIRLTYRIDDQNTNEDLVAEYAFQIVPSYTTRELFKMELYPDVEIESITRNGYRVNDFNKIIVDDKIEFDANSNPGTYVVTLKTFDSILQDYVLHEVRFNIQKKANSAKNYFVLSTGAGSETAGTVTLYYNPYWLFQTHGKITITLYKDANEQQSVVVDNSILNTTDYNPQVLFNVSDVGLYKVVARDSDNDPIYIQSWKVIKQESSFGYIILAVVLGLVGVAIIMIVRMRNKMNTK